VEEIAASDHRRKSSRSASAMPSSSAMTSTGNGAATRSTKSTVSPREISSSTEHAAARTASVRVAVARGVKRRLTS
jgi:hypothetical protein